VRAAVVAIVALLAAAPVGAGGGPTAEQLLQRPGPDTVLVMGTSDYGPGTIRVSFLVVRSDGKVVLQPRARVWLAAGAKERPFVQTTARLVPIGVAGSEVHDHPPSLYVAHLRVPRPGTYRLVTEPIGGQPIQGFQDLVVRKHSFALDVGDKAVESRTPTLASAHGDAASITTAVPPDRALLRYSVRDSLRAHVPFVLVFATPKFCTSRTCGPVVDVVDAVRKRYERRGVRFIHVEIYKGNQPSNGANQWVKEWSLPSEPFVFLVGRDGRIRARFEGSMSTAELEAAVRHKLL
jgi:hypothetical protein